MEGIEGGPSVGQITCTQINTSKYNTLVMKYLYLVTVKLQRKCVDTWVSSMQVRLYLRNPSGINLVRRKFRNLYAMSSGLNNTCVIL